MDSNDPHKVDVEDLVFGISALQVSALTHAAKLSPLISGCTLGPRSAAIKENQENDPEIKEGSEEFTARQSAADERNAKSTEPEYSIVRKALDFNVFNNNAVLRSLEKQRKDEVKRDLFERSTQVRAEEQRRQQAYQQSIQEQEKWIAGKVELDKQIVEEVEDFGKIASEESRKYFDNLKREEEKKLKRISFEVISVYQKGFKGVYEKIAKLLPTMDRRKFTKIEEYNKLLKVLIVNFENLKQKIRGESIGLTEVKFAANLLTNIELIYAKLRQEAERLNEELRIAEEEQKLAEQTKAAQESHAIPRPEMVNRQEPITETDGAAVRVVSTAKSSALDSFVSAERLEVYNGLMELYHTKLANYNQMMADENLKKVRSSWQKAINIPINTISAVSPQHLQDKFDKIYNFISGNFPKTIENPVNPEEHPLGRDFCLVLLAKKLVSQGETAVSSNAQAAFPIAAIIVALWQKISEFGKLFLACTYTECPYLVPYFIPQFKNQSAEDYCRKLGYKIVEGALEKQDMYLKRQSGIARLYSAVMVTHPRQNFGPHPCGIEHGWKWLCNILNLDPLPDICATVLLEFLQTAGSCMWTVYGTQFSKILVTMQNQYITKLSAVDEGGPKARLEVFLMKALKDGRIEQPCGMLASNFW